MPLLPLVPFSQLNTGDRDLTQVQSNVMRALYPLLKSPIIDGTLIGANGGVLTFPGQVTLKNLHLSGNVTADTAVRFQGQPYTFDVAVGSNRGLSVSVADLGMLYNSAGQIFSSTRAYVTIQNMAAPTANDRATYDFVAPFAGSVISKACIAQVQAVPAAQTARMDILSTGGSSWTGATFTNSGLQVEYAAKNTYTFNAGDRLYAQFNTSYSATGYWRFTVTVEFDSNRST